MHSLQGNFLSILGKSISIHICAECSKNYTAQSLVPPWMYLWVEECCCRKWVYKLFHEIMVCQVEKRLFIHNICICLCGHLSFSEWKSCEIRVFSRLWNHNGNCINKNRKGSSVKVIYVENWLLLTRAFIHKCPWYPFVYVCKLLAAFLEKAMLSHLWYNGIKWMQLYF